MFPQTTHACPEPVISDARVQKLPPLLQYLHAHHVQLSAACLNPSHLCPRPFFLVCHVQHVDAQTLSLISLEKFVAHKHAIGMSIGILGDVIHAYHKEVNELMLKRVINSKLLKLLEDIAFFSLVVDEFSGFDGFGRHLWRVYWLGCIASEWERDWFTNAGFFSLFRDGFWYFDHFGRRLWHI